MYQPSRGAARRLGPCLRAYQARPQERGRRDQDLSCIVAAWMGLEAFLRDLPAPILGLGYLSKSLELPTLPLPPRQEILVWRNICLSCMRD
ncbi:C6orf136 isoform 1 [Pan troglodytes]|uniref:C6orf136 isoform 1 n=1 Tax=Pan troglodytes TaxID=9598 RepID=A0A2J8NX61_PANTR|nr:C6orf136 isoform 1 [Pan troglodytes]